MIPRSHLVYRKLILICSCVLVESGYYPLGRFSIELAPSQKQESWKRFLTGLLLCLHNKRKRKRNKIRKCRRDAWQLFHICESINAVILWFVKTIDSATNLRQTTVEQCFDNSSWVANLFLFNPFSNPSWRLILRVV